MTKINTWYSAKIIFTLFITGSLLILSCRDWAIPKTLFGLWISTQKVTIRYQEGLATFHFVSDSVDINLNIKDDGKINGSVGTAKLTDCSINQNRGTIGKKLNLATDFVIDGKLKGFIFPADTIAERHITIPFNLENGMLKGTLFQKQGIDLFPMVDFQLKNKL